MELRMIVVVLRLVLLSNHQSPTSPFQLITTSATTAATARETATDAVTAVAVKKVIVGVKLERYAGVRVEMGVGVKVKAGGGVELHVVLRR